TTFAPGSYGSGGTTGSMSTSANSQRGAAAAAKLAMLRMAAAQWGRNVNELKVSWGVITVPGTGLRTTYGALMGGKLFRDTGNTQWGSGTISNVGATLKPTSEHKILGTRVPLVHIPPIVSAKQIYVQQ